MNQETVEKLKELAKSIAYFQSLHPDEQTKLWPLLNKSVQSTIELLEAISDQPRTYAELAAIIQLHPNTVSQKLNALSESFYIELGTNTAYAPPSKKGGRMRRLAKKTLN
ncbi:ArsR family transcriptional regulator [Laspinema palackyanum]|uniref:ArsR family transcriptional regulator n=1 Tax=Laspinema palackyanum TaxID=3231601 RepID=UPI00345DF917|nr:ArsR family transcriptional regulator [Laspinema sp. D2c]